MKYALIVIGIIAAAVSAFFLIRMNTPPYFGVYSYDKANKTGRFLFGGADNSFGNGAGTVGGRNGYDLQYSMNSSGDTTFTLFKNGKMIKTLPNQLA